MKDEKYRFTKLALNNFLWSLILFLPLFTLFPGVFLAHLLARTFNNCELGFSITLFICLAILPFIVFRYFRKIVTKATKSNEQSLESDYREFPIGIYTLLNTALLIIISGTDVACNGSSQSILVILYSGPLSSIGLILIGVSIDIRINTIVRNNTNS